ncbi:hypothetical protein ROP_53720 [Rhodococcus opacus B4]|uniref:Uncharacterized protein n=1 Tax=Rhodococcus opacus (strain B4) TaxID=632772 RepID=C1AVC9_RHOOB|nr:hypothetical protein ROP_53720 [Rhodococcus opacus B4]
MTGKQAVTLRLIELEDPVLHRAYLLKESLRLVFGDAARGRDHRVGPVDRLGPPIPDELQ